MLICKYHVQPASLTHHLFRVTLDVPANGQESTVLAFPAWTPGSYKIRDFSRHILTWELAADSSHLSWRRRDKSRWEILNQGQGFGLVYEVYAFDNSVRGTYLDAQRGFFNGAALFFALEGETGYHYSVQITSPVEVPGSDWELLTAMPADKLDARGFGHFQSQPYEALIDYPVEMGRPQRVLFSVRNIPHQLALTGLHFGDVASLSRHVRRICETQVELFGELPFDDQYLFLIQVMSNGYGGLEHRNSTALCCSRQDLEWSDPEKLPASYQQFLALCSHEYFHLWNGKRIAPKLYQQPDLNQEVHSRLLWLVEGVTSYYDELMLVRAGVITEQDYLDMLAKAMTRHFRGKGHERQNLAESSFDAWTKFYQQGENAPDAVASYYIKGGLAVLIFDLALRQASEGQTGFDAVMRHLWQYYGKAGVGVPEESVPGIIQQATGVDLSDLHRRLILETESIDQLLADYLSDTGIGFCLLPPQNQNDKGAAGIKAPEEKPFPPWLGVVAKASPLGLDVIQVLEDSPAARSGVCVGDRLLALGGFRLDGENLDALSRQLMPQGRVSLHAFRDDLIWEAMIDLQPGPAKVAYLWPQAEASRQQLERRRQWLHPQD